MIKNVENVSFNDIISSSRFDARFYYMGEILNKTLSNFKTNPLNSYCKFIRKGIFDLNSSFYRTKGIPFIRISNLMLYTIDEKGLVYIPIENHKDESKTKLVPFDLALSKIGKYLGKISYIPPRYTEVNISQNIIGVSFKCTEELKKYIFLYLTTPLAINQIIRVSKQHNQNKLTLPDIRNLSIPLLSEGKIKYYAKIVDELSILENDSFNQIKKAQKLFYDKLNYNFHKIGKHFSFTAKISDVKSESFFNPEFHNPLYNKSIGALKKYKSSPLSELVNIYKGVEVGSENYNLYINKSEPDIAFIRTSDIVNYEIDNYPDFFVSPDLVQTLKFNLKSNDILFSKDGSIANVALSTSADNVIVSSGFSLLRLKKNSQVSPYYIFCALSIKEIGEYQAKKRTVVASTIPHLRPQNISKILIPIFDDDFKEQLDKILISAFDKKKLRKEKLIAVKKELEKEFEI